MSYTLPYPAADVIPPVAFDAPYPERYGVWRRRARYTDGSLVKDGDRIRSVQAPGGILPPDGPKTGIAAYLDTGYGDPFELYLYDGEHYWNLFGHVTERED